MTRFVFALSVLAASTACSSVNGTVDGETTPITSTYMLQDDDYFGNDGVILLVLSGGGLNCEQMDNLLEELEDADDNDEKADLWADYLPQDFWEWRITLRVDDVDDDLGGDEIEGTEWTDLVNEDDQLSAMAIHYTDWPDDDSFSWWGWVTGDATDYYEVYRSDEGVARISGHNPNESIRGSFETEMVDGDGDDEGEVSINFSTSRCSPLESHYL